MDIKDNVISNLKEDLNKKDLEVSEAKQEKQELYRWMDIKDNVISNLKEDLNKKDLEVSKTKQELT